MKSGTSSKNNRAAASGKASGSSGTSSDSQITGQQADKEAISSTSPSYLQKFFTDQLKDIYYAEKALLNGLEEMKSAVSTEELQDAFETHRQQTERHVKRLEQVFRLIKQEPEAKPCAAMDGLLKEARNIISETEEGSFTRDAALIIAAQKVEHYEIATYGGLVQLAVTMDMRRAADILDKTLQEEEDTDQQLTHIAESYINIEAEHEGGYSWDKQAIGAGSVTL
ncbi:ferritin-like domain-containing protein [Paraflavitalea pollutisoli]|uniref:YciE/YciF ferroxidase family protein n=1 Tax=Paraflavitalea pollutisoli TaxID=3034143 RepID=UPI0023ED5800|nr:ferritin-like domain-containing protein [Paraflavitalea sp. H1-2-19X]